VIVWMHEYGCVIWVGCCILRSTQLPQVLMALPVGKAQGPRLRLLHGPPPAAMPFLAPAPASCRTQPRQITGSANCPLRRAEARAVHAHQDSGGDVPARGGQQRPRRPGDAAPEGAGGLPQRRHCVGDNQPYGAGEGDARSLWTAHCMPFHCLKLRWMVQGGSCIPVHALRPILLSRPLG
jgi:hypothetical protein